MPVDVYPSSLTQFKLRVVRQEVLDGPRESFETRPRIRALCSRAAIYCEFKIMQSSGRCLLHRWLLCAFLFGQIENMKARRHVLSRGNFVGRQCSWRNIAWAIFRYQNRNTSQGVGRPVNVNSRLPRESAANERAGTG